MNIFLLALGIALLVAALAFTARQSLPSGIAAYLALVALHFSMYICLPTSTFVFWGIAAAITLAIGLISPKGEPDGALHGNLYLTAGALAGLLVGISVDASVMILCSLAGAIFGELAYTRTPNGCWIKFPSSIFIHYFCAKGLKIVVTVAMIGIAIEGFITNIGR